MHFLPFLSELFIINLTVMGRAKKENPLDTQTQQFPKYFRTMSKPGSKPSMRGSTSLCCTVQLTSVSWYYRSVVEWTQLWGIWWHIRSCIFPRHCWSCISDLVRAHQELKELFQLSQRNTHPGLQLEANPALANCSDKVDLIYSCSAKPVKPWNFLQMLPN